MIHQIKSYPEDPVARQYEHWVYPKPAEDLRGYLDPLDPRIIGPLCWPAEGEPRPLEILVAGCGTKQAASIAFNHPAARVTAIDVSHASLEHEAALARTHDLKNLTLCQVSIEDSAALGNSYDLILATGVLHHLKDPAAGLAALKARLQPHGVIAIMLYPRHSRIGILMFQEMFRLLGLEPCAEDFPLVKEALAQARPDHFVKWYYESAKLVESDGMLVDTFLHRRERTYDVQGCLDLLDDAGLIHAGWVDNFYYHPEGQMPSTSALSARISGLPRERMWKVMELFFGHVHQQAFLACHPERPAAEWQIDFEREDFLRSVPSHYIEGVTQPDPVAGRPAMIYRNRALLPSIPLDPLQANIFNQIDGTRSIAQCLDRAGLPPDPATRIPYARNFFRSLWRIGHIRMAIRRE